MKKINLIEYPCGLGARKAGCADGPAFLEQNGLASSINGDWVHSKIDGNNPDTTIADYCGELCKNTADAISGNNFPITIGGDHSMAIGTWGGVTKALDAACAFGLIWFDAHMDAHTPDSSHSGFYHGMPLSFLLGSGSGELCSVGGSGAKLNPAHICLIGVRSYEKEEAEFLKQQNVRIFSMEEVLANGLPQVIKEAMEIVAKATKGYGITIDIDGFDPSIAPGTGSREKNGLRDIGIFKEFVGDSRLKAIEIAEYNPHLDKNGITSKLIFDILHLLTND